MIRNQIEAVINLIQDPVTFMYGTQNENNEAADRVSVFPLVMLYPLHPIDVQLRVTGSVDNTFDVYIEFMMLTKFEKNTAQNEVLVNQMRVLANKFLVNAVNYQQPEDNTTYFKFTPGSIGKIIPVYWNKDANMTGVCLTFKTAIRQDDYLLIC